MVETIDHGATLVHYHLQQRRLVRVNVCTLTDDVAVGLKFMHVAQLRTAQPQDGVEPAQTGPELDVPHFQIVAVGNVGFLVTYNHALAATVQLRGEEDGLAEREGCVDRLGANQTVPFGRLFA